MRAKHSSTESVPTSIQETSEDEERDTQNEQCDTPMEEPKQKKGGEELSDKSLPRSKFAQRPQGSPKRAAFLELEARSSQERTLLSSRPDDHYFPSE